MAAERLTAAQAEGPAGGGVAAAWSAAEHAARDAFGRLVAVLASSSRDIELAEDALSAAIVLTRDAAVRSYLEGRRRHVCA